MSKIKKQFQKIENILLDIDNVTIEEFEKYYAKLKDIQEHHKRCAYIRFYDKSTHLSDLENLYDEIIKNINS